MSSPVLSILIPVFNEAATITKVLDRVLNAELPGDVQKEIIIIDDASTDDSVKKIQLFIQKHPTQNLQLITQNRNVGKGAALHIGIKAATGDFLLIQDADLEYDPREYRLLLMPMIEGFADVVYGSRFKGGKPHRILFFWHSLGNKFLTFLTNMTTNLNLTDMETCYKLFRLKHIQSLALKEKRFGFEPEVTIKIARIPGIRIYETGISYYGRTYEEGKKINWQDGFRAIYCIFKYGFLRL